MTIESNARSHTEQFRWNVGRDDMSDDEARLHDLIALHRAVGELAREQRDLLGYYDTDAELLGPSPFEAGTGRQTQSSARAGVPYGPEPTVQLTVELDSRAWAACDEIARTRWIDELVDVANTVGRVSEVRQPVLASSAFPSAPVSSLIDAYAAYNGEVDTFVLAWGRYTAGQDFPCPEEPSGIHSDYYSNSAADGSCDYCGDRNRS
ncbi:hypothetical protein [Leucobacter luti]|uniref:Uncharacterized protein n=1 Tax=Leucobacter luti TaxID=340320 RepID=A0A4Q7U258_9MICO|nr:hypothetical protein [Leucobacter luti]RZT66372.1 hypothetical protein EV139_1809 [Leucobacter luti]